jgi:hypothetical protein
MTELTGHCLCGACRYAFDPGVIRFQAICHCASCQRASGAPFVGWIGVSDGHWRWTAGTPALHASSHGVTRGFCPTCGTQLTYASTRWPGETHFTAATLADPAQFHPALHVNHEDALHWARLDDTLPRLNGFGGD